MSPFSVRKTSFYEIPWVLFLIPNIFTVMGFGATVGIAWMKEVMKVQNEVMLQTQYTKQLRPVCIGFPSSFIGDHNMDSVL